MRIAIVTTSYPVQAEDPSGHFVRSEARARCARGDAVHVLAPDSARRPSDLDPSIRVWPVPHLGAFGWPGAAARIRARPWTALGAVPFCAHAAERLQRIRPELVIAHWLVPSAMPVAACGTRAPLVAVAHGADIRLLLAVPAPVRIWCLAHIAERATRIRFAASSSLDQLCLALPDELARQLRDKATVELPPIELPDVTVQAAALRRSVPCDRLVVLVARLVASKRVELAIDAMQFLPSKTRLHVIGDGPTRASLLQRDRLHRVTFAGTLPRKRTLAWIAAADVLIHTSGAEAAPTVVREARMLGTPVVACDAGDVARWAAVDPGIVVALPQVPALVDALRLLLR